MTSPIISAPMPAQEPLAVRTAEACRMLGGISPKTLWNWQRQGIGPKPVRVANGKRVATLYRVRDLNAWLDKMAEKDAPAAA